MTRREFLFGTATAGGTAVVCAVCAGGSRVVGGLEGLLGLGQTPAADRQGVTSGIQLGETPTPLVTLSENGYGDCALDGVVLVPGAGDQCWQNQLADGSFVPNSIVFVDRRRSDSNQLPGVDMPIPDGWVVDAWVDHKGRKQTYKVMGGKDTRIQGDYKVARATFYSRPPDWDATHAGMWARSNQGDQPIGKWVPVGTE